MQRKGPRFYGFLTGDALPCGQLFQQCHGVLKAQAALVDEGGILRAHIAPMPGFVGDLGDGFGVLRVAQDEAKALLAEDPNLIDPAHRALSDEVERLFETAGAMN